MTLFPLDSIRNGTIDRAIEPLLEDLRAEIACFPFDEDLVSGTTEEILDAFDYARPRLNLLAGLLTRRFPGGGVAKGPSMPILGNERPGMEPGTPVAVRDAEGGVPTASTKPPATVWGLCGDSRQGFDAPVSSMPHEPDTRGLDVGTGIGFFPVLVQRLGMRVRATEVDPSNAPFAVAAGVDVLRYRIGQLAGPVPAGSLDFLVFAEVLEHLKSSPVPVLQELASLLKPGGMLLLTTPNIARRSHIESLLDGENFLEPFPEDLPLDRDATDHIEHVREYSIREVVEAVEAAGLGVDQVLMTGWAETGYHPPANPYLNDITLVVATK